MPTVANGLLAEDFTSVTFKLKEGVTWSDGEPFTAADVVFTLDWILDDPANARRLTRRHLRVRSTTYRGHRRLHRHDHVHPAQPDLERWLYRGPAPA